MQGRYGDAVWDLARGLQRDSEDAVAWTDLGDVLRLRGDNDRALQQAGSRHPEHNWPGLRWFDLWKSVVRREPVVVRGAPGFVLKMGKQWYS